jgi:hypothetical protein
MKAEDSEYRLPNPKFHISLEHSMNRVAVCQPDCRPQRSIATHHLHVRAFPAIAKVAKGPESARAKMMASAVAVRAIIAMGMSYARIEQLQEAMPLTVKMASTIGKAAQAGTVPALFRGHFFRFIPV